ncbi:MAG TPA: hypothetical protein VGK25_08035 [Ignavibacteria bacterium]|jgi:hypothetical protein
MKNLSALFLLAVTVIFLNFAGCKEEVIIPVQVGSDLTRSGKFFSFTSNLTTNYDIYLAQVTSGVLDSTNLIYPANPYNLTEGYLSDDKQSNWSPDGRVLVFSRTNGIQQEIYAFFFKDDGSIDSSITEIPKKLFSSGGNWDNNPSFSPDGNYLIWDRREDNNGGDIDTSDSRDLFLGDVSGTGNNFQISNIREIRNTVGEDEYNPKWSPRISVRRVAYEFQSSATSTDHDVYIIDPLNPGNNVNFYNPNNSGYPAWAPECNKIIFESDKTNGDFWKIVALAYPTNNGQPADIQYEPNVHLRYPTWLPNGGLVAYIRFTGANGNIWLVSTNGGTPSKLLQNQPQFDAANNLWPAW